MVNQKWTEKKSRQLSNGRIFFLDKMLKYKKKTCAECHDRLTKSIYLLLREAISIETNLIKLKFLN